MTSMVWKAQMIGNERRQRAGDLGKPNLQHWTDVDGKAVIPAMVPKGCRQRCRIATMSDGQGLNAADNASLIAAVPELLFLALQRHEGLGSCPERATIARVLHSCMNAEICLDYNGLVKVTEEDMDAMLKKFTCEGGWRGATFEERLPLLGQELAYSYMGAYDDAADDEEE